MGVLLSSQGFEGVQFFDFNPKAQQQALSVLPKLSHLFNELHQQIQKFKREDEHESQNHNCH